MSNLLFVYQPIANQKSKNGVARTRILALVIVPGHWLMMNPTPSLQYIFHLHQSAVVCWILW